MIESDRRPYVFQADFDRNQARLDATGAAVFAIEKVRRDDQGFHFEIQVEAERWVFQGDLSGPELRGTVDGDTQFWLAPLPPAKPPKNRIEAWDQDLDAMVSRFLRYDRSFSEVGQREFRRRITRLRTRLPKLTDAQIMVELARAVALSSNAHTRVYLVRNRTAVRRLPLRVWWFREGPYVVRATEPYRDALGCRVTRVGRFDVTTAADRVRGIKAGNASWQRYMSTYLLTSPEILAGAGVAQNPELIPFSLACNGRSRKVRLVPLPLQKKDMPTEAWWDLAPGYSASGAAWISAQPQGEPPLFLRRPQEHYW
ncbi:MAG: hypothetical protein ACREB3_12640, partial [Burkholderiales bacterium]